MTDKPRKHSAEASISFLARMNAGKEYENIIKAFLHMNNVSFKTQVKYKTTLGIYLADFVLADGTIVETTQGDLKKCEGHPFISRKLLKLKELIAEGKNLLIVTPNVESWKKRLDCRVINDEQFLNENKQI